MTYTVRFTEECLDAVKKRGKKNPVLARAIEKKILEISKNPYHFKELRYGLSGERRVHILSSFVLRYKVIESEKIVLFTAFGHHDEAYRR